MAESRSRAGAVLLVVAGLMTVSVDSLMAGPGTVGEQPETVAPSSALLDRYCVTCHNERLQTADLVLDQIDLSDIAGNAPVLEKIVHKLRSGQMPPEGRPRPDAQSLERFVSRLEASLDIAAAARPNPGRVASRRLNRLEYANAITDLLALQIDGEELLPSDMAGFGFDNNADVLAVTPALMASSRGKLPTPCVRLRMISFSQRSCSYSSRNFGNRSTTSRVRSSQPSGTSFRRPPKR